MSLFGAIRIGANTLMADQIALQVIGQNIANANTPGYLREEIVLTPAPTQRMGKLLLGMGVQVEAVIQKVDALLEERLRGSVAEQASSDTQQAAYMQLESVLAELTEIDLSTAMNNFFGSVAEILNQPQSVSIRNLAVLQGKSLALQVRRIDDRVTQIRNDFNDRIGSMAEDINRLIEEIRTLNVRIAETEGGTVTNSDAVGLRDQRLVALESLARLIDIRTEEQPSGTVTVYSHGTFLVCDGIARFVQAVHSTENGRPKADIRLAETDMSLDPSAGELHGLIAARDDILDGFLDSFNDFARTLALEFNKVYSGGQGLTGFQELTSEFAAAATDQPLNIAGLPFTPSNGAFQILVHDTRTGLTRTTDVRVNLSGLGRQTTLADLAAAISAIPGLSASIGAGRKLTIRSNAVDQTFAFANDTSGVLAALGLNTFFSGSTSGDLGVSAVLQGDPAKFAASRGGIGLDAANAADLASFRDRPLASQGGASLDVLYDRLASAVTQGSAVARAAAQGAEIFAQTLRAHKMAISGVSIDEEAMRMIAFQRSFQAAARFIKTASDLLELLVSL